jgi:signal transduction histidine kinase
MEEALRKSQKDLRHLSFQLMTAQEDERKAIAQDLHDSIGQQLTGMAFLAKALEQRIAEKSLQEAAGAAEIAKLANQATDQTRALARGLYPVGLQAGSLVSALQELAETTQNLFAISCVFESRRPVQLDDDEVAANVYRIVQEAVNNAVKHGRAKNIWIRLETRNRKFVVVIENDGLDFPGGAIEQTGLGLRIMGHRAEIINGSVDIHKRAEGGTIVTCAFTAAPAGRS